MLEFLHPTYVFVLRNTSNILNMLLLIILSNISDKAFPIRNFFAQSEKLKEKKIKNRTKRRKRRKKKKKRMKSIYQTTFLRYSSLQSFSICVFLTRNKSFFLESFSFADMEAGAKTQKHLVKCLMQKQALLYIVTFQQLWSKLSKSS